MGMSKHRTGKDIAVNASYFYLKIYNMKTNLYILLLLNSIVFSSFGQKNKAKEDILRISGIALLNDQPTGNYSVSIYLDGTLVDSLYTKSKRIINFNVDYNKVYTLLFQKVNCFDKLVIVNTHIPEGSTYLRKNTFDFEVEMSERLSKKSTNMEDHPIAVLLIGKNDEKLKVSSEYNDLTHSEPDILTTNKSESKRNQQLDKK